MKLERAQEIYSDYVDGTLSPAMKLALEQHFEADAGAKRDYEDFSRIFGLLSDSSIPELELPYGFRAKIMERVAAEASGKHARGIARSGILGNLFAWPSRRLAAGLAGAVIVVGVAYGIALHPGHAPNQMAGTMVGVDVPLSRPTNVSTVIQGVDARIGPNNTLYHDFRIHLPSNIPAAMVQAYSINATDQILDPAVRERDATPVLAAAQYLTNDEEMKIPVAVAHPGPEGSTLNILFEWRPNGAAVPNGAQIVFTPLNPNDSVSPSTAPPSNGNFFDSLQTIASAYHTTVIADASDVPATSVQAWSPGDDVRSALNTVADSVGYAVKPLDANTYLVYRRP